MRRPLSPVVSISYRGTSAQGQRTSHKRHHVADLFVMISLDLMLNEETVNKENQIKLDFYCICTNFDSFFTFEAERQAALIDCLSVKLQ
jgi:hypothetical protein